MLRARCCVALRYVAVAFGCDALRMLSRLRPDARNARVVIGEQSEPPLSVELSEFSLYLYNNFLIYRNNIIIYRSNIKKYI